jgi:type IV pilus assembly protein PilB
MATVPFSGLARAVLQQGLITAQDGQALIKIAQAENLTFLEVAVKQKKITAVDLAQFASNTFGVPILNLDAFDFKDTPHDLMDPALMLKKRIIPLLRRGNILFVATIDPTLLEAFQAITFKTDLKVEPIIVEDDKLSKAISRLEKMDPKALFRSLEEFDLTGVATLDEEDELPDDAGIEDAPVVKLIHKILVDAIDMGASDIHFEPYEKFYRVRYRKDGGLREIMEPPSALKDKMASRIKVMARLDISEKRIPQDGRIKLHISKHKSVDLRVSVLPTLFGEKIVMRILDSTAASLNIEMLGFEASQKALLLETIERPYGMVLVTGPTGSGKTVSLYTALNILNKPDINISTAEDPAEINLPGINQVNINDKTGMTFSAALKSFLRQDPDIIMVGEIRDYETADIAIKAAQTGHMVFSTLHTNDAPTTLTRLLNMGIAPFNVASAVLLIMAQRLGRRLCSCKKEISYPKEALLAAGFKEEDFNESWTMYAPNGCELCMGSGYKGRLGIYELMPITDAMQRLIMSGANAAEIRDLALSEGMINLRRSGLLKVKAGLTSLAEIEALTNQ